MVFCARLNFSLAHLEMWRKLWSSLYLQLKFKQSKMTEAETEWKKSYKKVNKTKCLTTDELNELSHEQLVHKVQQLEAQNVQLKNILRKRSEEHFGTDEVEKKKKKCDFTGCTTRHVLLKLYYFGWDCQGYVTQDDTANTIEHYLFRALEKCCLIEKRVNCNYQKCGRTDKGVSAFCQVISIDLKSKLKDPTPDNCAYELPYLTMINRLLPPYIKCYAWAHVDSKIGARFDCTSRTYFYYFPKGDLNIMYMKEGARQLIGEHDFRNFCKMDIRNAVTKYVRNITHADITPCSDSDGNEYSMYKLTITGSGFLWHQIRCIMAVLFFIGGGKESPDIVNELLDVEKNPQKPQYQISDHTPLTLFDCGYDNADIKWNICKNNLVNIIESLQTQWTSSSAKELMIKEVIDELSKIHGQTHVKLKPDRILVQKEPRHYKPLLARAKCPSLEDRIDYLVKRGKLVEREGSESVEELKAP